VNINGRCAECGGDLPSQSWSVVCDFCWEEKYRATPSLEAIDGQTVMGVDPGPAVPLQDVMTTPPAWSIGDKYAAPAGPFNPTRYRKD
jgi:hypothetical protein